MRSDLPKAASVGEGLSGTNLVRAGDHNQRVTLQAVRANGPITRAEVSTLTGLTAPAIANITTRLANDGLIMKDGRIVGARGQPATKFVVNPEGAFSIGLNIDRDHVTLLVMDLAGIVRDRVCFEARFALPDEVLDFVKRELERITRHKLINPKRLIGIGIGIPDDLGRIFLPHKPPAYEQWSHIDVAALFSSHLNIPAYVENDATAAAIGELQFGQGLNRQHFLFTLISAGLGSGIIINGQPYKGADGRSGEIGFIPQGVLAGSGREGILQDNISLYALYEFMARNGFTISTPDDLKTDDPQKLKVIDNWIEMAVEDLVAPYLIMNCAFNPEVHFIGGRLPAYMIDKICDKLNSRLRPIAPRAPVIAPFVRAAAADDAAPMGAAVLVFQHRLLPRPEALMKTSA
jgi:predicted NBD/HSP70 family sugar kinase